jgi:biotin carboxylase
VQHDFPADRADDDIARITEVAEDAARALELTWGPIHVELTVTADGPCVIEVNPRLAGAYIPKLVELALGVDLVTATIQATVGEAVTIAPTRRRFAAIRFLMRAGAGTLRAFTGLDEAAAIEGIEHLEVRIDPGASLSQLGDFRDRIGSAIAVADDASSAQRRVYDALALVGIERDP